MSRDKIRVDDSKLKYLNVHHLPVCCTFYFLGDDEETPPVLDVSSKEERLSKSRLSIVMNTYEDVCGMSTFGGLNIDQSQVLKFMKVALKKTKYITSLVREKWSGDYFSLLDFSQSKPKSRTQNNFIENLNSQLEQNKQSHPSFQDQEMNSEEEDNQEQKLIELVQENSQLKKQS